MKSKYIKLVEKVLSEKKSHLTVAQIWETARNEGYLAGEEYGDSPQKAITASLNLYLRRNSSSDIKFSGDIPRKYCLWSYLKRVNCELTHHDEADIIIDSLSNHEDGIKMEILIERIKNRKNKKTEFRNNNSNRPIREANVIAYVRLRSEFKCELCGWCGFRKENGSIYIEVHHLEMISYGGADVPENAVALCPDCHRKMHYAENHVELMNEVINKLAAKGISVSPIPCTSQAKSI